MGEFLTAQHIPNIKQLTSKINNRFVPSLHRHLYFSRLGSTNHLETRIRVATDRFSRFDICDGCDDLLTERDGGD
jgi:hypothetical protein